MDELKRIGNKRTATSAIFIRNGMVLLGLRHYKKSDWKETNVWTTPGGRSEDGETLEHCLRRETREETGMTEFFIREYVGTYPSMKKGDTVHCFLCDTTQEPFLAEPEKFSEWRWFPLDKLPRDLINPHLRKFLKKYHAS